MSVVNKMLNDLEARQQSDLAQPYNADYQPPAKAGSGKWIAGILAVTVIAAVVLWMMSQQGWFAASDVEPASIRQPQAQPVVQAEVAPAAAAAQADMTGLQQVISTAVVTQTPPAPDHDDVPVEETTPADDPQDYANTIDSDQDGLAPVQPDIALPPAVEMTTANHQGSQTQQPAQFSISTQAPASGAENYQLQARLALEDGDTSKAINLLSAWLKQEPDNLEVRKKLAALQFSAGRLADSERVLLAGLNRHPENTPLTTMLARLYVRQQRETQALETLSALSSTQDLEVLAMRASLARDHNRFELARQDYTSLIDLDANNPAWWLGLAICLEQLEMFPAALRAYQTVQGLGGLSPQVADFVDQRIGFLVEVQ